MGSIYNPKWRARNGTIKVTPILWIKYRQHGRVIRESTGTTKETVARRMLKVREGDVEHGIPIDPTMNRITFEEAAADVVNDYQANGKRSLKDATRRIALHLQPAFAGRRMIGITTADVRAYIAARQDAKASNATVNRELALLKRAFSLAVKARKLTGHPDIPLLREDNVRAGFFEPEQLDAVCRHLPPAIVPVIRFAAITGWRVRSEVLPLEWRQVDFGAGRVRLDPGTTKNRKGREFPFTADLETLLTDQRAEHDRLTRQGTLCPYVFHRDGAPIRDFHDAWTTACKAAGCPGRIPHDLRRTAVRTLVRAGISEHVAMKLTGHETRSVFDRYDIVSGDDLRAAAGKLDAMGTNLGTNGRSGADRADRGSA